MMWTLSKDQGTHDYLVKYEQRKKEEKGHDVNINFSLTIILCYIIGICLPVSLFIFDGGTHDYFISLHLFHCFFVLFCFLFFFGGGGVGRPI